jgi:hypothetical protein
MTSSENTFKFSPGHQSEFTYGTGLSWDYHLAMIREWLKNLKREISVVDPWAELAGLGSPTASNLVDPDARFAPDEIRIIHAQLDSIAAELERLEIGSSSEREAVRKSFDHLKGATERVGKKDWYLMFIGAVGTMVMEKIIASDTARSILGLVGNAFHKVLGLMTAG